MTELGKNILYIGGFELPDKNAAAQRVIANAKLIRSLGHEVKLLGVNKKYFYKNIDESYSKHYDFDTWSIPYPKSFLKWISYVSQIKNIKSLITEQKLKIDIIITYNFPALASSKLFKYCKRNNIKIIADITEWYNHKPNSIMGIIKYFDSELRMKYFNKKYDGLICISKYLIDYYKNSKNSIQLPPLVDLDDEKWKVKIKQKKDKLTIVYAGLPGGKDKINLLIDAMLLIENIEIFVKFRIIGISKKDFFYRYNSYTKSQVESIDKFVLFLGRLPHIEVIKEVSNADFSAFLRENNLANNAGFPTKFVESISCGTPVITNRTSNLEDYLIEGSNGFWIDPHSVSSITECIANIINIEKENIFKMKKICSRSIMFDYRTFIDQTRILLNNL